MAQTSRAFRIFVSSTFSDLKDERNAQQEKVFPRQQDQAAFHGCRCQAFNLRQDVTSDLLPDEWIRSSHVRRFHFLLP